MVESTNSCADEYVKTRTLQIITRTASWLQKSMKILRCTDVVCWQNERRTAWERFPKHKTRVPRCMGSTSPNAKRAPCCMGAFHKNTKRLQRFMEKLVLPPLSKLVSPKGSAQNALNHLFNILFGVCWDSIGTLKACVPKSKPSQKDVTELPERLCKVYVLSYMF